MKKSSPFIIIFILLMAGIVCALTTGQYHIKLETLREIIVLKLSGTTPGDDLATPAMVLWSVRLPRVLMAVVAGAALSVGGVVFQGIMRNPLVARIHCHNIFQ